MSLKKATRFQVTKAILSHPGMITARPAIDWFFFQYLSKFTVQDVDGKLILHSHLPPLNSKAYGRFLKHHLLTTSIAPSHMQIGVTNACPQACDYCYNKSRTGRLMDLETVNRTIGELRDLGVFWVGLTGGEPLLNKHLEAIVEQIGDECAVKLFTTGSTLTRQRAVALRDAGIFSVAVSLDHHLASEHDRLRNYPGAYKIALEAIETFRSIGGLHVSVSAVLQPDAIEPESVGRFLEFLEGLGIHEAWLSEAKPSNAASWRADVVVTAAQREMLISLQDEHNRKGGMTVNYLGHFEDARYFGCTAGHKMISIDPFGEVSPCVFIPMSFGNVREKSVREIYARMLERFPAEGECYINRNFGVIRNHFGGTYPISQEESANIAVEVDHTPRARFFRLQYR